MRINEIFESIQGEGSFSGSLATFIRLQGCSLGCSFCDSTSTWSPTKCDCEMSVKEVLVRISKFRNKIIVITGGEPTEQPGAVRDLIVEASIRYPTAMIAMESNGTYDNYEYFSYLNWLTISPKRKSGWKCPKKYSELKLVVDKEMDAETIEQFLVTPHPIIFLQPCDYGNEKDNREMFKKVMDLVQRYPMCRAGVQLHKIYGVR